MNEEKKRLIIESDLDVLFPFSTEDKMRDFLRYLIVRTQRMNEKGREVKGSAYMPLVWQNIRGKSLYFEVDWIGSCAIKYLEQKYSYDEQSASIIYDVFSPTKKVKRGVVKHILYVHFFGDYSLLTANSFRGETVQKNIFRHSMVLNSGDRYGDYNGVPFNMDRLENFVVNSNEDAVYYALEAIRNDGLAYEDAVAFGYTNIEKWWRSNAAKGRKSIYVFKV